MSADDEAMARRSAYILGDASAAALAIRDMEAHRAKGENAGIWLFVNDWIVGPRPYFHPPAWGHSNRERAP